MNPRTIDEFSEAGTVSSIIITMQNDKGEKRASLVMLDDLPSFIRSNYEKSIHAYGRLLYSYGRDSQAGPGTPEEEHPAGCPGHPAGELVIGPNGQDGDAPEQSGQTLEPNSP